MGFPGRVAFADPGQGSTATASRMDFPGPAGRWDAPDAVRRPLSGQCRSGLDPCAALQRQVVLAPGATVDLVFQIGQDQNADAARALIARIRSADIDAVLADVTRHWTDLLGAVQVRSPDRAMDVMLNGWLFYQTLACRIWARAGFCQASGAYGFRDQLQDGMALTFSRSGMTRAHLLLAAGRQFPEGDVQHWWPPHSGQGLRTCISDDRVWLGDGVALTSPFRVTPGFWTRSCRSCRARRCAPARMMPSSCPAPPKKARRCSNIAHAGWIRPWR
jgi:cyclic beta-1,2-glucan synthetase